MMIPTEWQKVDGNLNINDLLKFKNILACYLDDIPEVKGEYLIYFADGGDECAAEYKCKQDGTIIEIRFW